MQRILRIRLRFLIALLLACRLRATSFCMIATVCSTWVFVNRSTMLGGTALLRGKPEIVDL